MSRLNINEVDARLTRLLNQFSPTALNAVLQQAGDLLISANTQRVMTQKNIDGSDYQQRKRGNDAMLTKLPSRLAKRVRPDHLQVGLFGLRVPQIHHHGLKQGHVTYPSRQILGFSNADKLSLINLLEQHAGAA